MNRALDISVLNRQRGHKIATQVLSGFVEKLTESIPPAADSIAVCLVSDAAMRRFNRRFRQIDRPTDVLSFPAGEDGPAEAPRHLGDILISVDTAGLQATEAGHTLDRELKLLILHGYLHLLGHDHETDDGEMMQLQEHWSERLISHADEVRS